MPKICIEWGYWGLLVYINLESKFIVHYLHIL
jgi:hypothetical protein